MSLTKRPLTAYFAGSPAAPAQDYGHTCYPTPEAPSEAPAPPANSGGGVAIVPIVTGKQVPGRPNCWYLPHAGNAGEVVFGPDMVCRIDGG